MGLIRCRAEATFPIGFVVLIVPFEPDDLAVALERQHVRRNPVQEPPIVADEDGAPGEIEQGVFERTQRVDVQLERGGDL